MYCHNYGKYVEAMQWFRLLGAGSVEHVDCAAHGGSPVKGHLVKGENEVGRKGGRELSAEAKRREMSMRGCVLLLLMMTADAALAQSTASAPAPATPVAPSAGELRLGQTDAANIERVCVIAMDNVAQNIVIRTNVGQFCLDLLGRISRAGVGVTGAQVAAPAPATPSATPEKK